MIRGLGAIHHLTHYQLEAFNAQRNIAKGSWEYSDLTTLLELLRDEVRELEAEIRTLRLGDNPDRVIRECADVANFAVMIADVARNNIPF